MKSSMRLAPGLPEEGKCLRILIVDDDTSGRLSLLEMLTKMGHECSSATQGEEALQILRNGKDFDLILCDLRMPVLDGDLFFKQAIRENLVLHSGNESSSAEAGSVAFMTAYGDLAQAIELMRVGAIHFLMKPLKRKDLEFLCQEVFVLKRHRRKRLSRDQVDHVGPESPANFIAQDPKSKAILQIIDQVAPTLATVLITGESGTGKELLAKRVHEKSLRKNGPFIALNAAALPDSLLESELFGHERGAFTGAHQEKPGQLTLAHGGTFFLDEVASMSLNMQAKLLRVIQEREVRPLGASESKKIDVRWVTAANQDLEKLCQQGKFREDLLYRLRVVSIDVAPLRLRPGDIDALIDYFSELFTVNKHGAQVVMTKEARAICRSYGWPGNVRELRNVIERGAALCDDGNITVRDLPKQVLKTSLMLQPQNQNSDSATGIVLPVGTPLREMENHVIRQTLALCGGDKAQAAQMLGINLRTIYRWLERLG